MLGLNGLTERILKYILPLVLGKFLTILLLKAFNFFHRSLLENFKKVANLFLSLSVCVFFRDQSVNIHSF